MCNGLKTKRNGHFATSVIGSWGAHSNANNNLALFFLPSNAVHVGSPVIIITKKVYKQSQGTLGILRIIETKRSETREVAYTRGYKGIKSPYLQALAISLVSFFL